MHESFPLKRFGVPANVSQIAIVLDLLYTSLYKAKLTINWIHLTNKHVCAVGESCVSWHFSVTTKALQPLGEPEVAVYNTRPSL